MVDEYKQMKYDQMFPDPEVISPSISAEPAGTLVTVDSDSTPTEEPFQISASEIARSPKHSTNQFQVLFIWGQASVLVTPESSVGVGSLHFWISSKSYLLQSAM